MRLARLASCIARQAGGAKFAATRVATGGSICHLAQAGTTDHQAAPIPRHLRSPARAAAGSSEFTDTALLVTMGCIALALGLTVYLVDRNASHHALIPTVTALAGGNLFGALGQWLPAAIHPFAFSLFTAAALPSRSAWRYGSCAAWCAVNAAFELGQHPLVSGSLAGALEAGSGRSVPGRMLANYFLRGTFDGADMIAAVLGALAAAAVLHCVQRRQEKDHAS